MAILHSMKNVACSRDIANK